MQASPRDSVADESEIKAPSRFAQTDMRSRQLPSIQEASLAWSMPLGVWPTMGGLSYPNASADAHHGHAPARPLEHGAPAITSMPADAHHRHAKRHAPARPPEYGAPAITSMPADAHHRHAPRHVPARPLEYGTPADTSMPATAACQQAIMGRMPLVFPLPYHEATAAGLEASPLENAALQRPSSAGQPPSPTSLDRPTNVMPRISSDWQMESQQNVYPQQAATASESPGNFPRHVEQQQQRYVPEFQHQKPAGIPTHRHQQQQQQPQLHQQQQPQQQQQQVQHQSVRRMQQQKQKQAQGGPVDGKQVRNSMESQPSTSTQLGQQQMMAGSPQSITTPHTTEMARVLSSLSQTTDTHTRLAALHKVNGLRGVLATGAAELRGQHLQAIISLACCVHQRSSQQ